MKFRFFISFFLLLSVQLIAQDSWNRDDFIISIKEDVNRSASIEYRRVGNAFLTNFIEHSYNQEQEDFIHHLIMALRDIRYTDAEDFHDLYKLLNYYVMGGINDRSFNTFLSSSLAVILNLNHKKSRLYIMQCSEVLINRVLHTSTSFQWKFGEGEIVFRYDSIPKICSNEIQIYCKSQQDSISIEKTNGYIDLLSNKWYGVGGSCDWTKHSISKDSIWVSLNNYFIDLKKRDFEAYNVELKGGLQHNQEYLIGRYIDGLSFSPNRENAIYPSFISNKDSVYYYSIFEDVDAKGCLELSGNRMIIFGRQQQDIQLVFYENDQAFVEATAKRFKIQESRIFSEKAKVEISWNNDSIVHPQLKLYYNNINKNLSFERDKINLGLSPIRSSYHKLDCFFDRMVWNRDSAALFFLNNGDSKPYPAVMESFDFYHESRFEDIASLGTRYPVFMLQTMSRENDYQNEFILEDIAKYYNCSINNADILMTDFTVLGFVDYNRDENVIHLNEKLFNFLDAKLEKRDYDGLKIISSVTDKPNAKMDLKSGALSVSGVSFVELSDSNQVSIFPYGGDLVVHQNRDFTFDGVVETGRFALYGKTINFVYDSFELVFNNIDSLQYAVPSDLYDNKGLPIDWAVNTVISDLVGTLSIDAPNNKSGLKDYPEFPKLKSIKDSYIYYDNIKDGVYERDLFSFKVDPFQLDSLLIIDTYSLEFPGYLNAPSIFPLFPDTLTLDKDLELSFIHEIKNKYPVYQGKGFFTNKLNLDNSGLSGEGTIYYLNSVTETDSVYFYPNQVLANANKYDISKQITPSNIPKISVSNANIDWRPYLDEMKSSNRVELFECYQDNYDFDGSIILSPYDLSASGEFYYDNTLFDSDYFVFQSADFTADSSLFILFEKDGVDKVLIGRHLFSTLDVDDGFGSFETFNDSGGVELRKNMYELQFDLMEWDRFNQSTYFTQYVDDNGTLLSLDPCQDSLKINAVHAQYDLSNYNLNVNGVSQILMSLATVIPDSSHVHILANGEIDFLENASFSVDSRTATQYDFYNAELYIHDANNFSGKATFDYVDLEGINQAIDFSNLVMNNQVLNGKSFIEETDSFYLNPYYSFKGNVIIDSSKDYLLFEGETRIHLSCDKLNRSWIPFNSYVDPDNVIIDLKTDKKRTKKKPLYSGILLGANGYYPSFLGYSKKIKDYELIGASGYINYDEYDGAYVIASKKKIKDRSTFGDITFYYPDECTLYSEGEINIGEHSGLLNLEAFGFLLSDMNNQTLSGTIDLSLDFLLHHKVVNMIITAIYNSTLTEVVDQSSLLHQEMLEYQLGRRLLRKYNLKKANGKRFIPSSFEHTFYFPQLNMNWNPSTSSFISDYELPINNIDGHKIDLMVPGVLEIQPRLSGDKINLYIEVSPGQYYFFTYQKGVMNIFSTDKEFNTLVSNLPNRLKKQRGKRKLGGFRYDLGNIKSLNKFLDRIKW